MEGDLHQSLEQLRAVQEAAQASNAQANNLTLQA